MPERRGRLIRRFRDGDRRGGVLIPEDFVSSSVSSQIALDSLGLDYQRLLDLDTNHEIPAVLRFRRPVDLGLAPVKASRYTSADFFRKEVEKVWFKTWQYACREEEIPNPGDTYVFDLIDRSLLVVRQEDGSIRALRNVCRHRGRKLMTESGCRLHITCPYHGFSWNIDGSFRRNPFATDFPQISESTFGLGQARVEVWAGFVFVNFNSEAPPLLSLLGEMPDHFEHWRIRDCYKAVHVAKVVAANWKATAEAFLEVHHVLTTHPQAGPFLGADISPYDFVTDHVTRFISPTGVTSQLWPGAADLTEQRRIEAMLRVGSRATTPGQETASITLTEGMTARSYMADIGRKALEAETGYDFSGATDAELLDGISYDIFPNFHIWGGFAQKICYRFRPIGADHERTLMEVMLFKIAPKDKPRPAPASMRFLGEDEAWAVATELSYLAGIYDQDQSNLAPVQQGLRDLGEDGEVLFSRYAEMRCRNLHRMIDVYLAR